MATQPIQRNKPEAYVDDSLFERFDGVCSERPVPGLEHARVQRRVVELLSPFRDKIGGEVLQEWSISDGSGDWLTPDVTFSYQDMKTTRRGHLLVPAYLVVEIRSPDQALRLLFDKQEHYRKWNVAYYWIVDPVEGACYECITSRDFSAILLRKDSLRAGEIEIPVAAILGI